MKILNQINFTNPIKLNPKKQEKNNTTFKQFDYFNYANLLSAFNKNFINFTGGKHVTKNNKKEIIDLYNEGKTQSQIAKMFDCHPATIKYALQRWGISKDKTKNSKEVTEIKNLIEQGKTVKEISAITGFPISRLRKIIFNNNIEYGGFSEINKDRIIDLYNQGLNYTQIANIMNCTHATIRYSLKKWGIEYKSHYERITDEIIELYKEGKSSAEIASVLDSTRASVIKVLKKNGIDYKPVAERNKNRIIEFYNQGKTIKEIAEIIGCSCNTITTSLKKWGIKNENI